MAKKKCPEFENHERWLVAFADMMTLLFALFVVLYALANDSMAKMKKVETSVRKAFGMETEAEGPEGKPQGFQIKDGIFKKIKGNTNRDTLLKKPSPETLAVIQADTSKLEREIFNQIYGSKSLAEQIKENEKDQNVFISADPDGVRVSLMSRKFFKPSSTELSDEAKKMLSGVANAVKNLERVIRIEGHTDNLPFNLKGMSNWELSSGRAASVVRYFISDHGFDPKMIYAAGYADTRPLADNETADGRSKNRRVDIKIMYEAAPSEDQQSEEQGNNSQSEGREK
jgi:chemotaxis protein MotB